MKKIPLKKPFIPLPKAKIRINKNSNFDVLNFNLINTKFEETPKAQNLENQDEHKNLINRIKQIFISKTNCSKFTYHSLISYSIGKYDEYSLYLKTILVELSLFKNEKLEKIEKTYFHPSSTSFSINYQNLAFIFYISYNHVQIVLNCKENFYVYAQPDIKNIRKHCFEINNIEITNSNFSKNKNLLDPYTLNNSSVQTNKKTINNELIKNPFYEFKDKKIGFSCKIMNKILEIKYGFEKIYLNGYYETKQEIKLPFKDPKVIEIPIDSIIFLEIQINTSIKNIKKEIHKKIHILKILGFNQQDIFYIGVLYNNNNKNNKENKSNNSNYYYDEEDEIISYNEENFNVFIYNCDTYFLGQKISLIKRIFPNENIEKKLLRNISVDKGNIRKSVFKVHENEKNKQMVKKLENNAPISFLKSLSNNFSLFDDDILYAQINMN